MKPLNISYIKLKKDVKDDYTKSLKGWKSKLVNWRDMEKVLGDSRIQFSYLEWRNGVKTGDNVIVDNINCICLDSDDGFTIHQVQKMFRKFNYIIGTSKSHMKEKKGKIHERFRVIVPVINTSKDVNILLRSIELMFPFNDRQTETRTAAFLGNNNAIIIYNETGRDLDMFKVSELASQQIEQEKLEREAKKIDKDLLSNSYGFSIEMVKEQITREVVVDILESIGIDVVGNKCKLRDDERTHSCKIYSDGGLYDFGSGEAYDIFKVLMDIEDMTFKESVNYVRSYI